MKKLLLGWLAIGLTYGQTVAQSWEVKEGLPQACQDIVFHPHSGALLLTKPGETGFFLSTPGTRMEMAEKANDLKVSFEFNVSTSSELTFWIQNKYPVRFRSLDLGISGSVGNSQPLENAGLSSGLWQTVEIVFSGAVGQKPAKIEELRLNGRIIQQQLFVQPETRTTGGFVMEATQGISAFRYFKYLAFGSDRPVRLANLSYSMQGTEGWEKTFELQEGKMNQGTSATLTSQIPTDFKHFILTYQGDLVVDKEDDYTFTLDYQGVGEFSISGKPLVGSGEYIYRVPSSGTIRLKPGTYRFQYKYQKIWWSPGLGLFVGGTTFRPYALHESNSLNFPDPIGQVNVEVGQNQAELIRGFMMFQDKKVTTAFSIGLPGGRSVAMDLAQGAPLFLWKGSFLDVTEMWHERGEPQLMAPNGVIRVGSGIPSFIPSKKVVDSLDTERELVFKGYTLNDQDIPTLSYEVLGKSAKMSWRSQKEGLQVLVEADPLVYHVIDRAREIDVFEIKSKKFWEKKEIFYRVNNRFIFPQGKMTVSLEKLGEMTNLISRSVLPQSYLIVW